MQVHHTSKNDDPIPPITSSPIMFVQTSNVHFCFVTRTYRAVALPTIFGNICDPVVLATIVTVSDSKLIENASIQQLDPAFATSTTYIT